MANARWLGGRDDGLGAGGVEVLVVLPVYRSALRAFRSRASQTRSRVTGSSVKRMPVASRRALANAGATGLKGLSLIDLAPSGPIASDVSVKWTSVRGTSAYWGSR